MHSGKSSAAKRKAVMAKEKKRVRFLGIISIMLKIVVAKWTHAQIQKTFDKVKADFL